ncbi:MAG: glycosyltransferase, partial [Acidobacteriota bacterium]
MSRISVIIPTLEEEADLARLLACLDPAREEVIVVDGRSRDGTCDVARSRAGVTLLETRPPRSRQLNAAAARASGDVLLFLHADAIPPRDWREAILRALADERVVGGAFDLAIDAHGTAPRLVAGGARLRRRVSRSPYGDQGRV